MDIILSFVLLAVAIGAFVVAYFQFKEKGFLFNNAYIYASKKERDMMNKKPHYRQSAIVFFGIGVIFLIISAETILHTTWLNYPMLALMGLVVIYALASSISIYKKHK